MVYISWILAWIMNRLNFEGDEKKSIGRWLWSQSIMFCVSHELGHILLGHFEQQKIETKRYFFEVEKQEKRETEDIFRREIEADIVAAVLLTQYIEHLENTIKTGRVPRLQEVFAEYLKSDATHLFERLVSITILSLYAFFTYIAGRDPLKFNQKSAYPHPLIRALYIKDVLIQGAQRTRKVNKRKILDYNLHYFNQFDAALDEFNLNQPDAIIANIMDHTDTYINEIQAYASRFRQFTKRWTWIPLDNWTGD